MASIVDELVAQARSAEVEFSQALMGDMVRLSTFVVTSGMPESGVMVFPPVAPSDQQHVVYDPIVSHVVHPPVPVIPVLGETPDETIIREGHQEELHHQKDMHEVVMKSGATKSTTPYGKSLAQKLRTQTRPMSSRNRRLQQMKKTTGDMYSDDSD